MYSIQVTDLLQEGGSRARNVSRRGAEEGLRMLQNVQRSTRLGGGRAASGPPRALRSSPAQQQNGRRLRNGMWECSDCGREFASEHALDQHCEALARNSGARYESSSGSDSGSYSWECDVCEREFATERALRQHEDATGH
jgi:ribosomal protein L37AE/L43A